MSTDSWVYSSQELIEKLDLSKDKFWELVHAGIIPSKKLSLRKYLFPKVQIDLWLASDIKQAG